MKNYFLYATENECFNEDKIVSKKVLDYNGKKVGFVLLNTAPLSLLGGNAEDMSVSFPEVLCSVKKINDSFKQIGIIFLEFCDFLRCRQGCFFAGAILKKCIVHFHGVIM